MSDVKSLDTPSQESAKTNILTKNCESCSLEIPSTAKICTHCNISQNKYVRNIRSVSAFILAIVAMFPLFQAAKSLDIISKGPAAKVRLHAAICTPDQIILTAINGGTGPAFISDPKFKIAGRADGKYDAIVPKLTGGVVMIPAAGSVSLPLKGWINSATADFPRHSDSEECKYVVSLSIEDANETTMQQVSCLCPVS